MLGEPTTEPTPEPTEEEEEEEEEPTAEPTPMPTSMPTPKETHWVPVVLPCVDYDKFVADEKLMCKTREVIRLKTEMLLPGLLRDDVNVDFSAMNGALQVS